VFSFFQIDKGVVRMDSLSLFTRRHSYGMLIFGLGVFTALGALPTLAQTGNLPSAIERRGTSLGLESPNAPVSATVWLNPHNQAELDAAVKQLYTKDSTSYHKWMSHADLKRFQPTPAEVAAVEAELAAHHLSVLAVDPANSSVKFAGATSDFESAFHTQLSRYKLGEQVVRITSAPPQLAGAAEGLVYGVTGVKSGGMHPFHVVPLDPATGKQLGVAPFAAGEKPQGAYFSNACLGPLLTASLKTGKTAASYTGFSYGANPANTKAGTVAPCGYAPQDVWNLYSLNGVYKLGYTGAGQTVVVVDAYGSPTIFADLATFSSIYKLPAPTADNFQVYVSSSATGSSSTWATETTLDVEWAHAIAPDATITLIEAPTSADDDLQSAVLFAVDNRLGNVISNSYGGPESEQDPITMLVWDEICEMAAAQGISVHFATGDEGDYAADLGYTDVSEPANSPHATAVGGTSMLFSPANGSVLQTGWGTNITELSPGNDAVDNPPVLYGFQGGSGGGVSQFFTKPAYQARLSGAGRHLPDVSAIADSYTGVEVILTVDGTQYFELIGGTSLATPVFSAIWALFDQYNVESLGQAAPYIAAGSPYFVDVLPVSDVYNTTGHIGSTYYSTFDLSEPLENTTSFGSALWNYGGGAFYNLTFGTDSSLTITAGWDSVTGYGTPSFASIPADY
jgi:subtilase family serine protease